jgi:hypothetical protein
MNIHDSKGFKAYDRSYEQSKLADTSLIKSDLLTAINEARQAQNIFSDKLFILENLLEAATEERE